MTPGVAKKGVVVAQQYLGVGELPARPDPETGLPRPPPAPWFIGSDRPFQEDSNRERARRGRRVLHLARARYWPGIGRAAAAHSSGR